MSRLIVKNLPNGVSRYFVYFTFIFYSTKAHRAIILKLNILQETVYISDVKKNRILLT